MDYKPIKIHALILLIFITLPFFDHLDAKSKPGGELIITTATGIPRHFNPAIASGSAVITIGTQIFASPLRYDDNWNPLPYLAESWKLSKDGQSVTLNLIKGALFHDGHPITSSDVAFSIKTVKKFHPFKPMFAPVKKVETPDPHTVIIKLEHPHPAILLSMSPALLPILPEHIYGDGQDLKTHPANLSPIGSGPFKFQHYKKHQYLILEKNEQFFIPDRPYLERITFRFERNVNAQMIDMERQAAHMLPSFFNPEGIDRLKKSKHLESTSKGYEGVGAGNCLYFNLLREPLNDQRVRQAIGYAVDKDYITQYLHKGYSKKATGPIIPESPFYEPDVPMYKTDLDKANQLLDKAGYIMKSDGHRFSLLLDHYPLAPSMHRDVALFIKKQLSKIGIHVEIRKSKRMIDWMKQIANWNFDMTLDILLNWGDPVIGVHRWYSSKNIRKGMIWSNCQNYRNTKIDHLLEKAGLEMDIDKRKLYYSQFQKIVAEELPVIWINLVPAHTVFHKNLRNLPLTIWGVHSPFDRLYWEKLPDISYTPVPVADNSTAKLKRIGIQALTLIQEKGFYHAQEILKDPVQEYLDLKNSGLHVIGFTKNGFVFLDNSSQMKRGMDISRILDLEGVPLFPQLLKAAAGKNNGFLTSQGVWPHPITHKTGPMSFWCGLLTDEDVICVPSWSNDIVE